MATTDFSKTLTEKKTVYGKSKSFTPCGGCPSPSKCRAAGKCMAKAKKSGSMGGSDRRKNRRRM